MNYKGKLYGKIAGKYFDTGVTSEDYDRLVEGMEILNKGFEAQHEVNTKLIEQNRELVANIQLLLQSLDYDALGVMSGLIIEDLKELLTKYNHLNQKT